MSRLVGIDQAAQMLGVSRDTVRRMVKAKELKAVRVRRRVLLRREDLESICNADQPEGNPVRARSAK